jgi:hypothetical protein
MVLAGIYLVGLGALAWAIFFDHRLLDLDIKPSFLSITVVALILFGMQAALLCGAPHFRWPKPTHGTWIYFSIAAGALMAALLTFGFIATLTSLNKRTMAWLDAFGPQWAIWGIVIGVPWIFWFCIFALIWTGSWLGKFRRMYRLLLAGTWLELLVTVPVNVAVRKRTTCYCDEGTFFSMTIGITMIFWTFGPGVALLFFSIKRRSEYPEGVCQHCGYDLRGLIEPRCPECGTGFTREVARL